MTRVTVFAIALLAAADLLAQTYTVTNTNDSGPGSLRQAILDSNVSGGTVAFDISSSPKTIVLLSVLPEAIATIDGTTQPGYSGTPLVEIDGAQVPGGWTVKCVSIHKAIKGLAVNRCPGTAVFLSSFTAAEKNYIGVDLTGSTGRGSYIGIQTGSPPIRIVDNVISGNAAYGIDAEGYWSGSHAITGNIIGTNASATAAIPNGTGVLINTTSADIGAPGAPNVIAGNSNYGIEFWYGSGSAKGNYVGVSPAGIALPNDVGIHAYQRGGTIIGGDEPGAGNTIAYNTSIGIHIEQTSLHNRISRNSIFSNGIGIDLSNYPYDGPTPNDYGDYDTGPNLRQNYPVITGVVSGATTMINGTLDTTWNATFTLEFFSSPACNAVGYGEGTTYLATTTVTTDSVGRAAFAVPLGIGIPAGYVVTATATDSGNNTSEFSACRVVEAQAPGPVISSVSPTSGPASGGTTVTVTGTTFPATAAVKFGSTDAGVTIVNSDTSIQTTTPALTPGTLNDVVVIRPEDNAQGTLLRGFFADFLDVPQSYPVHGFVEKVFRNGITGGCSVGSFCPNDVVLRSQMAIFLLRGMHGGSYLPPPPTGTRFTDVPAGAFAAGYIEQLAQEGITGGCTTTEYCPNASVLRSQMAVFLLRAKHGSSYAPPPATGIFQDVPVTNPFAPWIEQLYNEGITTGCAPGLFCPAGPVSRGQMSVFLSRTFGF